jgi:hypothetical protein
LEKQSNAPDVLASAALALCQSRFGKNRAAQKSPCLKICAAQKFALPKNRVAEVKRLRRIAGPEIAGNINRGRLPLAGRLILQFVVDLENARVKKSFPEPATVVV